jgi:hypothetical protein
MSTSSPCGASRTSVTVAAGWGVTSVLVVAMRKAMGKIYKINRIKARAFRRAIL